MTGKAMSYSKPCQAFKTENYSKVVNNRKFLTIFTKSSVLGVWHGSENVSEMGDLQEV